MLSTAKRITDDPWLHHKLLANVMSELSDPLARLAEQARTLREHGELDASARSAVLRADLHPRVKGVIQHHFREDFEVFGYAR